MNNKVQESKSILQRQLAPTDFLPDNFRSRITPAVLKSQVIPHVDCSVKEYRNENRKIVKSCAKKYVRANISEYALSVCVIDRARFLRRIFYISCSSGKGPG